MERMLTIKIPKSLEAAFHDINTRMWVLNGIYYGYPACCILDFLKRAKESYKTGLPICTAAQWAAHKDTGFVPCQKHALKIKTKLDLTAVVKTTRMSHNKFPKP